jgi:hypothetical protein
MLKNYVKKKTLLNVTSLPGGLYDLSHLLPVTLLADFDPINAERLVGEIKLQFIRVAWELPLLHNMPVGIRNFDLHRGIVGLEQFYRHFACNGVRVGMDQYNGCRLIKYVPLFGKGGRRTVVSGFTVQTIPVFAKPWRQVNESKIAVAGSVFAHNSA